MKRFILCCLLLAAVLFRCSFFPHAEGEAADGLTEGEWTWEENSIATFLGSVSLEGLPAGKLLLKLSFTTDPKGTNPGEVVFQTVDGKKLTIRKQKPEYVFDHGEQSTLEFIGNWKTPDDVFFTRIDISFQICTEDRETVLAERKLTVTRNAAELAEKDDGKIRLKVDLSSWILWAAIGAGVLWVLAAVRVILNHKTKKKGR